MKICGGNKYKTAVFFKIIFQSAYTTVINKISIFMKFNNINLQNVVSSNCITYKQVFI